MGAQWLSGRALDSRPKGRGFEPHRRHCVVSLSKNINPSLVLVQPRKIRPFITERLLMGRKESNQTNKQKQMPKSEKNSGTINLENLPHPLGPHYQKNDGTVLHFRSMSFKYPNQDKFKQ